MEFDKFYFCRCTLYWCGLCNLEMQFSKSTATKGIVRACRTHTIIIYSLNMFENGKFAFESGNKKIRERSTTTQKTHIHWAAHQKCIFYMLNWNIWCVLCVVCVVCVRGVCMRMQERVRINAYFFLCMPSSKALHFQLFSWDYSSYENAENTNFLEKTTRKALVMQTDK